MTTNPLTTEDFEKAALNLADFFEVQAEELQADAGFTWRPSITAPNDLASLTAEYRLCQLSGMPVRVSSLHCETTIYPDEWVNLVFRFVHDSRHVQLQAEFDLHGELTVAEAHRRRLVEAGFAPTSLEFLMLVADTAGQTLLLDRIGRFPNDQRVFVERCVRFGLDEAIRLEQDDDEGASARRLSVA